MNANKNTTNESGKRTETPREWWGKLKPMERMLAQQIAVMIEEATEDKRIEIRWEMGSIRARFIHILKQPEKGCLSAIVLPEAASGVWK